jgi:hypothetical protein
MLDCCKGWWFKYSFNFKGVDTTVEVDDVESDDDVDSLLGVIVEPDVNCEGIKI